MPYCFACGKEIYLIQRYMKIQDCICENCKASFSVLEKGQVDEKEMERAYWEYQKNYYLTMKPGMPYKEVVNRMLAQKTYSQKTYSGKMYHPNQRNREPWSTLVAKHDTERRVDMTDQIEKIIDKIHDEYRGLSRSEIEKIVRQTAEEIRRKNDEELARSVAGTE